MQTEIRFHEGLVGSGVVISLSYGKDRVIFDFGARFKPDENFFDGIVKRRKKGALRDALILGETAAIDGIYPRAALERHDGSMYQGLIPYEESDINSAVLISHYHLDHMSNICYLADEIPVYMHKGGLKLHNTLKAIGEETPHDNIIGLEYGETIKVGAISCTPHFTDHPCLGAVGYYIETPDMKTYYTGDVRFHGLQRERAFEEIEKMADYDIDVLIADATSFSPTKFIHDASRTDELALPNKDILDGMFLESSVYEDMADKLRDSDKLGLFGIYHRDPQLIGAVMDILAEAGRTVVFEAETAHVVNQLLDRDVLFYLPDSGEGAQLVSELEKRNTRLSVEDINKNKDKYLVQLSYKNILQLHDFDAEGGFYFHLFGEPFGTDNKSCHILRSMLQRAGTEHVNYSNCYSFNHAFPNHLSYAIGKIKAKNVVAVHSNCPEKLNPMGSRHVLPKQFVPYVLRNGVFEEK